MLIEYRKGKNEGNRIQKKEERKVIEYRKRKK